MQVELPPVACGRGRQRAGQLDAVRQVLDRLDHGRAPKRSLASLVPIIDSDIKEASLRIVMRQGFRLGDRDFGELLLQHVPDPGMESLASAAQQGTVSSVLDQGVLEHESGLQRGAAAKYEPGAGQLIERIPEFAVRPPGYRDQLFVRKFSAERRPDLRHLPDGGEAVEPGKQRCMQARWNGE